MVVLLWMVENQALHRENYDYRRAAVSRALARQHGPVRISI